MFCVTLEPKFYFCISIHKQDDTLYIHSKKDSMSYFVICIVLPELPIYLLGVWFFDKFENKVLSQFKRWKSRSQFFADFDNKIVILGENGFEWIAFCWV